METDFLWPLNLVGKLSIDIISIPLHYFDSFSEQNCNLKPEQANKKQIIWSKYWK